MRAPAVADRFYPADEEEVRVDIETCFRTGPGMPRPRSSERLTRAVVVPHAGYVFSGVCAAYSFKALAEEAKPEAYIVIGPDHYGNGYDLCTCTDEYWTPFGECGFAWDVGAPLLEAVPDVPEAHAREHSIEVELPFLKYIDPDAEIIPIIMGDQSRRSAEHLANLIRTVSEGREVVVIASSDLVHYEPKEYADRMDSRFLGHVKALDVDGMYSCVRRDRLSVCGYGPIAAAILATSPSGAEILCQTDSSASGYEMDTVVGYGAVRMF